MNTQSQTTNQKPLRIAIDANEANVLHRVGSNVFAFEIISALERITRTDQSVTFTVFISKEKVEDMPVEREGWTYQSISPSMFATQWAIPLALFRQKQTLDLFFTPGHYAPRACPIPYVTSVMDLAFLEYPHQFKRRDLYQLKHWTRYSVKNAQHVVAISEFTKQDIVEKYRLDEAKISVIYPSLGGEIFRNISVAKQKRTLKKFSITKPFFLYVGTLQPRKNLLRLIRAFEKVVEIEKEKIVKNKKQKHPQLVLAGKIGWLAQPILDAVHKSPAKEQIILTSFITDQEKATLYQHAQCSVLVGLYEGFGMPPLESLAYGTLPIVSNTTSLPEVVGECGIQVDPMDIDSITDGLTQALSFTKAQKKALQTKAKKQVQKFSWEKSGRELLEVFRSVVGGL